jgi:hypothetical protein
VCRTTQAVNLPLSQRRVTRTVAETYVSQFIWLIVVVVNIEAGAT